MIASKVTNKDLNQIKVLWILTTHRAGTKVPRHTFQPFFFFSSNTGTIAPATAIALCCCGGGKIYYERRPDLSRSTIIIIIKEDQENKSTKFRTVTLRGAVRNLAMEINKKKYAKIADFLCYTVQYYSETL